MAKVERSALRATPLVPNEGASNLASNLRPDLKRIADGPALNLDDARMIAKLLRDLAEELDNAWNPGRDALLIENL